MVEVESYHEITVSVLPDDVEAVSNYIIENLSTGLLLEDEDGNSHTTIKFYISTEIDIDDKLDAFRSYLREVNPAYEQPVLSRARIDNLDWIEAYRRSVVPVDVGDRIVIIPPWSEERFPDKTEIIIEPKMAFGTGRHESTRGCLAELEPLDLDGKTLLDLGCGSGVLGIYAALRGARSVIGYDNDPLAVENSIENFAVNEVGSVCRAYLGTIDDVAAGSRFDIVVVNIIKKVIVPIVGRLKDMTEPGGHILLAGLMDHDADEVDAALREHGLTEFTVRHENEWITYSIRV